MLWVLGLCVLAAFVIVGVFDGPVVTESEPPAPKPPKSDPIDPDF